jgi:DNA-binding XRE family transcriptional regulator
MDWFLGERFDYLPQYLFRHNISPSVRICHPLRVKQTGSPSLGTEFFPCKKGKETIPLQKDFSRPLIKKQFQNSLGVEFRKLRKRSCLTQTSVATTASISLPAIRKLERGLGNLTTWTKALDALGWTLRGRNLPSGDSIGRQVAILRKRQKLSQRSLAAMAGITQPTVIALEVRNSGYRPQT